MKQTRIIIDFARIFGIFLREDHKEDPRNVKGDFKIMKNKGFDNFLTFWAKFSPGDRLRQVERCWALTSLIFLLIGFCFNFFLFQYVGDRLKIRLMF